MSVLYRRMTLEDVDAVHAIEEATFPTPWSRQSFVEEMTGNKCARASFVAVSFSVIFSLIPFLSFYVRHERLSNT